MGYMGSTILFWIQDLGAKMLRHFAPSTWNVTVGAGMPNTSQTTMFGTVVCITGLVSRRLD